MENYFVFMGLPETYFLSKSELRKVYLENIKKYNPDKVVNEDEKIKNQVLEMSSINHTAYKTLANEELRLAHLLQVWGLLDENGNSNMNLPQNFLMEMMDLNELLEENPSSVQATVQTKLAENQNKIETLLQGNLTEERKKEILQKFLERKYLLRLTQN